MTKMDLKKIRQVVRDLKLAGLNREQIAEFIKYGEQYMEDKEQEIINDVLKKHNIKRSDITRHFGKRDKMIYEIIDTAENELSEENIEGEEKPSTGEKGDEIEITQDEAEQSAEIEEAQLKKEELSEKGKKLYEKVEKLEAKIRDEKNPLKLHLLQFKLRMLVAKIQRELDLINIKESYNLKRDELKLGKEQSDKDINKEIALLMLKVNLKKQELHSNSEYDYKSSDFGFNGLVKSEEELQVLTTSLKADSETKLVAENIERMSQVRQEIEKLQEELKSKQQLVHDNNKEYARSKKQLDFEEKRLTVINKYNIFSRIGDFFKNVKQGINDIRADMIEMKQLKKEYEKEKLEAKRKYEAEMADIARKSEEAKILKQDERKSKFLNDVKLKGKELEEANEPVQIEPAEQEVEFPNQEETL